jgi:hypothetical protein
MRCSLSQRLKLKLKSYLVDPRRDHQGWDHTCIEKEAASIKGRSGAAQERARGDSDLKLQVAVEIRRRLG